RCCRHCRATRARLPRDRAVRPARRAGVPRPGHRSSAPSRPRAAWRGRRDPGRRRTRRSRSLHSRPAGPAQAGVGATLRPDGTADSTWLDSDRMDDREYHLAADTCLERASRWLGDEEELDVTSSDGLVTVEFEDGSRLVLNRQSAAHQMWLAAGARAWHYGWDVARASWRGDPARPPPV